MRWVENATPRPLYPRERPGTHCIGGWVGPRVDLDGCGKSSTGIRSSDRPARSQSLYRLSYRGPFVFQCFSFFLVSTIFFLSVPFSPVSTTFPRQYHFSTSVTFFRQYHFFHVSTIFPLPVPFSPVSTIFPLSVPFFPVSTIFFLSVPFHHCSIQIFILILLLTEGRAGEVCDLPKHCSFVYRRRVQYKKCWRVLAMWVMKSGVA